MIFILIDKRAIRILVDDPEVPIKKGDTFYPYGINNYYLEDDMTVCCHIGGIGYSYKPNEYEFIN